MVLISLFYFPTLKRKIFSRTLNERGQGLIEYLVIVALMGVATIAIVRVMGQTVQTRFAAISGALQGKSVKQSVEIDKSAYANKKDLGNFMNGTEDKGGSGGGHASGGSDD